MGNEKTPRNEHQNGDEPAPPRQTTMRRLGRIGVSPVTGRAAFEPQGHVVPSDETPTNELPVMPSSESTIEESIDAEKSKVIDTSRYYENQPGIPGNPNIIPGE